MPEQNNIAELHSEEIKDIIGRSPSWVIFRGNVCIAIIILLLLISAWVIKYPDIISAPVIISSYDPPIKIIAQSNGKILHFYANDGDHVGINKIVAVVDNPANTNDILELKNLVESIDTTIDIGNKIREIKLPQVVQLGEMQSDYAVLYEAISNYKFFLTSNYYLNKLTTINSQEENNNQIEITIKEKEKILNNQLKTEAWKDSVNKILLREKVIALSEYNEIRKSYLTQRINDVDNLNSLLQNKQQRKELQKSRSDVKQEYKTAEKDVILSIRSAAKRIKGQIGLWEKLYVLKSPAEGKLVFFGVRKANQYVHTGAQVFIVVPESKQYEIHVQLPLYKAGKVKKGQQVLIKMQEFPYEEFGMLKARIENISNVAIDSNYTVELKLENGFKTTRNKSIEGRPEISGTADIITNEKNILQRIFEGVYGRIYER